MAIPDIDSATLTYGAPFVDFIPVQDTTKDQSGAQVTQMLTSAAAATRSSVRAIVQFRGISFGGGITIISHDAVWGNDTAFAPTITQPLLGQYNITWPTTVIDEIKGPHTVNFRYAYPANVDIVSQPTHIGAGGNVRVTSASSISVFGYDPPGTLSSLNGYPVTVFIV